MTVCDSRKGVSEGVQPPENLLGTKRTGKACSPPLLPAPSRDMTIERYGGPPPVMHEGVKCDGCGETPLRGTRRRCLLCIDADFCPQCCDHHRHDAFIVLPKPAHAAWSETLQLMTCFGALAGADEFDGRDGLNAPPPPGLNDRLRAFINQGAHAICPPGPALCPMVNPASHLERLARSRRIAHVREDARRLRTRDATEATQNEILNPRLFDVVDELHPWNMPRDPAEPDRFASEGLIVYLPRRSGGNMCLVSDDGFPLAMVQVYAVDAGEAEKVETNGEFFGDVDGVVSALTKTERDGQFTAAFAKGGVEVRAVLTNVSNVGSVRVTVRCCDAQGECVQDGSNTTVFESELGPLESVEHVADGDEGRALLLGATGAAASYLKFTVSPTDSWIAMPLTNAMWEGARWHALDMFVAKRRAPDAPRGNDWPWFGSGGIPVITERRPFSNGFEHPVLEDESRHINHVGIMPEHRGLSPEELRLEARVAPDENNHRQNAAGPAELAEPAPFVAGIEPKHPTSSFETIDKDSTAAPLRLGRVVAEPSDPMPAIRLPAPRWSPNPAERSAVLGLFVQPNLASPPAEPERTTKHNAAVLIDAARDRKLVDVYERAARDAHRSDTCVVCLESEPACDLILLPCKHQCMHAGCMSDMVRRCPLCRVKVDWTMTRGEDGRYSSRQHGWSFRGHVERQRVR